MTGDLLLEDFDDPTMQAISDLVQARDMVRDAERLVFGAYARMPTDLQRLPRVMVGYTEQHDRVKPVFVHNAADLDAAMEKWATALKVAGGDTDDLRSVELLRILFHSDLKRDSQHIAQASEARGVSTAVGAFNEALKKQEEALQSIARSKPTTLRGVHALAHFVAQSARQGEGPESFGQAAHQVERSLAELAGVENSIAIPS
jgi:hypothetical protein